MEPITRSVFHVIGIVRIAMNARGEGGKSRKDFVALYETGGLLKKVFYLVETQSVILSFSYRSEPFDPMPFQNLVRRLATFTLA